MGRPSEGWKTYRKPTDVWHVRFTHQSKRYDLSTGVRDKRAAGVEAGKIYAAVLAGKYRPAAVPGGMTSEVPLADLYAKWICAIENTISKGTAGTYLGYCRHSFVPLFGTLAKITTSTMADYGRTRLGQVKRDTVQKELSTLHAFLRWCEEKELIAGVPLMPALAARAPGTPNAKPRVTTDLTNEEVARFLSVLPEYSSKRDDAFAVRAFFEVAWETGLRPKTLQGLVLFKHFQPGQPLLLITEDIDKARFARPLPISPLALEAIQRVMPRSGLIFGKHDMRPFVRKAARKAGIQESKVQTLTPYDMRHGRITDLLDRSGGNLPGVAYMAGHKQVTTTNKYAHGKRRHAQSVIDAVSGTDPDQATKEPEFWCYSGAESGEGFRCEGDRVAVSQPEEAVVRRRGLEPLRCYPLAPQSRGGSTNQQKTEAIGLVERAENLRRGVGSGAERQNSEPRSAAVVRLSKHRLDWSLPVLAPVVEGAPDLRRSIKRASRQVLR